MAGENSRAFSSQLAMSTATMASAAVKPATTAAVESTTAVEAAAINTTDEAV